MIFLDAAAWFISLIVLLVVAKTKFDQPPTRRSGTTWFLFSAGLSLYFLLTLSIWTLVILTLRGGGKILADFSFGIPDELAFGVPVVAMLLVVLSWYDSRVKRLDAGARSICERLAATPLEMDNLVYRITRQSVFRLCGDPQPDCTEKDPALVEKIIAAGQKLEIDGKAFDFSNTDPNKSLFTKSFTIFYFFLLEQNSLPKSYRLFLAKHSGILNPLEKDCREFVQEASDFFRMSAPKKAYTELFRESGQKMFVRLAEILARAVLFVERTENRRYRRLQEFGFEIEKAHSFIGMNQYLTILIASIGFFILYFMLFPGTSGFANGLFQALIISVEVCISTVVGVLAAYKTLDQADRFNFPPVAKFVLFALSAVAICSLARFAIFAAPLVPGEGFAALGTSAAAIAERWPWRLMPIFFSFGVAMACRQAKAPEASPARVALLGGTILFVTCSLGMGLVDLLFATLPASGPGWPGIVSAFVVGGGIGAVISLLFRKSLEREEEIETRPRLDTAKPAYLVGG